MKALSFGRFKVVAACMCASKGKGYFSKYIMTNGVVEFYKTNNLFPQGLHEKLPAMEDWAAKVGQALARLVP